MQIHQKTDTDQIIWALVRLVVLSGFFVWLFRPELIKIVSMVSRSSESIHALVAPIAAVLIIYCRRDLFAKSLTNGSWCGIGLMVLGIAIYAGTTWPFNYGQVRDIAMIPTLAGVILVAGGWRVLKLSLPILILLLLAIPISVRIYAALVIRPETYTIKAVAMTLEMLPGIDIVLKGVDVIFSSDKQSGVVALGESFRGVRLLMSMAMIGVFVLFSQSRSIWRILAVGVMAIPVILFCNFLRFLCWGLIVIYTPVSYASPLPRNISALCCLFAVYGLFAFISSVNLNLFIEVDEDENSDGGSSHD